MHPEQRAYPSGPIRYPEQYYELSMPSNMEWLYIYCSYCTRPIYTHIHKEIDSHCIHCGVNYTYDGVNVLRMIKEVHYNLLKRGKLGW